MWGRVETHRCRAVHIEDRAASSESTHETSSPRPAATQFKTEVDVLKQEFNFKTIRNRITQSLLKTLRDELSHICLLLCLKPTSNSGERTENSLTGSGVQVQVEEEYSREKKKQQRLLLPRNVCPIEDPSESETMPQPPQVLNNSSCPLSLYKTGVKSQHQHMLPSGAVGNTAITRLARLLKVLVSFTFTHLHLDTYFQNTYL